MYDNMYDKHWYDKFCKKKDDKFCKDYYYPSSNFYTYQPKSLLIHVNYGSACGSDVKSKYSVMFKTQSIPVVRKQLEKKGYRVKFGRDITDEEYRTNQSSQSLLSKRTHLDLSPLSQKLEQEITQKDDFDSIVIVKLQLHCAGKHTLPGITGSMHEQGLDKMSIYYPMLGTTGFMHEEGLDRVKGEYSMFDISSKKMILMDKWRVATRKRKVLDTKMHKGTRTTTFKYTEPFHTVLERAVRSLFDNLPNAVRGN